MKTKNFIFEYKEDGQESIDRFLVKEIKKTLNIDISRKQIQNFFLDNLVSLNGKKEKFRSKKLLKGQKVEVQVPLDFLKTDVEKIIPTYELTEENIIYEDDAIVVANKPSGLPSQGTLKPTQDHFYAALQRFLDRKAKKKTYLAIHHRLDTDTSGLILFCKKKSANKNTSALFQERNIQKVYLALCENKKSKKIPDKFTVKNNLLKTKEGKYLKMVVSPKGLGSHTEFKLIKDMNGVVLLECYPVTGRMHQIRVHCSEYGIPICGDFVYGEVNPKARLMLHAWKLTFPHPLTGKVLNIVSPQPPEFQKILSGG